MMKQSVAVCFPTNIDYKVKLNSILVVDDTEMDLLICKRTLMMTGISSTIYTETSARSALHFLVHTNEIPDLIVLDYLMPEMDGLEFIREFSKLPPHISDKCKIALQTAYTNCYPYDEAMFEIQRHKQTVGIFKKPMNMIELQEKISKWR